MLGIGSQVCIIYNGIFHSADIQFVGTVVLTRYDIKILQFDTVCDDSNDRHPSASLRLPNKMG
jgi:hypothetical protein